MFKSKTSMRIISLLVAIGIWLYVMGGVDPETRTKIGTVPVNFINTEMLANEGMAVACDEQEYISVSISGKRSDVNEAKKNGLTASIDVAECEMGENTEKITVNLPDGIKLENMSESAMTFKVDKIVYEYKPVEITFGGTESLSDSVSETVPWVMSYYPEKISVSGAKCSVDKIVKLTGTVEASEAVTGKEKKSTAELLPVNKKGREIKNVVLYQEHAQVDIRLLYVKSVELLVVGGSSEVKMDSSDIPERVRIAGPEDIIADIEAIKGVVTEDSDDILIDVDLPEDVFVMIGEENGKIIWN